MGGTPGPVGDAGREAMVKVCGVAMAMLPLETPAAASAIQHALDIADRARPSKP